MNHLLSEIRARKLFLIPIIGIIVFLTIRTIILQKPSPDISYTVKKEDLVDTVQVSGTYTTASQTIVASPANGTISQLYVSNGQSVHKGDPLFHVDSTATTDQQNAAYAAYAAALSLLQTAQNNVQSLDAAMWSKQQAYLNAQNEQNYMINNSTNPATKNSWTDLEKLAINNAITQTQKDFQAAEQAYKTAGVTVTATQATVTQTKQVYDETKSATVYSPANGKVVNLQDQIGDSVISQLGQSAANPTPGASTDQAAYTPGSQQPVLIIANLSDPYISVNISEDYATRVMQGQPASVEFDAWRGETFPARVSDLATVGTNLQGVVTYAARIQTSPLPVVIKPNMTALVTIETLRRDNVIDVPNSAIVSGNGNTYVLAAKTHKQIPVVPGEKGVAKTEITSGLDEGTVIVANPNSE
jgi:HlyD family secretion protein